MIKKMLFKQKINIAYKIYKNKTLEYIRFESRATALALYILYYTEYVYSKMRRSDVIGLIYIGKIFRHVQLDKCRQHAVKILNQYLNKNGYVEAGKKIFEITNRQEDVQRRLTESIGRDIPPFDKRLLILSAKKPSELGVLAIKFTENFKYFMAIFDIKKLSRDYIVLFEPSFSGYFDEDILCLMGLSVPAIIESPEKIDYEFIRSLNVNLIPTELGASSWVDNRVFHEEQNVEKIYDVIMVALWADFKRHYHLFEALSKCKNKNKIRVALVGAPWPNSMQDIKYQAEYYDVLDNIDFYERLTQKDINSLLNKSKTAILLSKKEGINKSIIESMHANVPTFVLEGFNYGYKYPYINEHTGGFIEKSGLTEFLDNIDKMLMENSYTPRKWISAHMSAEHSTSILKKVLEDVEQRYEIKINKNIVHKINNPDFDYRDKNDRELFRSDYEQLKEYIVK